MGTQARRTFKFARLSGKTAKLFPLVVLALLVTTAGASAQVWKQASQLPTCKKIAKKKIHASLGAQMACLGPQANGPARPLFGLPSAAPSAPHRVGGKTFSTSNIDAASPSEDQIDGTQWYGQSETSIAAAGNYVVEAWNDATGFFAAPCSPQYKDQLTGFGFSSDGGKTFTDEGGLPNANCATSVFEGDPSVEVYQTGGNTYFYISSLFFDSTNFEFEVAMDVCHVTGSTLSCNSRPVIIAAPGTFGFDDKDFMSIDAQRGLLYASYTDFTTDDAISLSVCDVGNGALGGTPTKPVCNSKSGPAPNYIALASADAGCAELEGAYPAVDEATGDVYVAWEFNWATNTFGCQAQVQEQLAYVPAVSCIAIPSPSPCTGGYPPIAYAAINIVSMDAASIPGYNRSPANDFPRLAVSDPTGTVSMVWNDARANPSGDILLQSFRLGTLAAIQSAPVKLNNDRTGTGAFHFMPALRNVDANGDLNVSWYDRRLQPSTDYTDVYAALGVSPAATTTPKSNLRVTNVSSDWLSVSSDIVPNFGDYTDNYVEAASSKHDSAQIFAAWSDGRINDPQPFCAHQRLK